MGQKVNPTGFRLGTSKTLIGMLKAKTFLQI
jgi:hypothetical protein